MSYTKIVCSCGKVYNNGQEADAMMHLMENKSHIQTPYPTKCHYCQEEIADDYEYNEHMLLMHPAEIDNYENEMGGEQ